MSWDNAGGGETWGSGDAATDTGANEQWGGGNTTNTADTGAGDQWGGGDSGGANDFAESGNAGTGGGGGGRGGCFNCGEEGHNKSECTNPPVAREFSGTCRLCEQEGHRAADCPSAPPKLCNNCGVEGHSINDCKNPRKLVRSDVVDMKAEDAWDLLKIASEARDLDDIKVAAMQYVKATPDATYIQLEKAFRGQGLSIYLIAIEKELTMTYTNMDLQGNLDKKYTVTWRLSPNPKRPKEKEGWPTPEENLVRLQDAGEAVERGIPKCTNCNQLGHIYKSCPEDKQESADRVVVKCVNCEELGHRSRDCPKPRLDKFACRNCKQSGHTAKECPEPRSAEGVECKKCNEIGHFSRDCPQGGGGLTCHNCGGEGHRSKECEEPKKIICRNCDAEGHTGKECPKPRDWTRVKCNNCGQMGHGQRGCKEPPAEENAGGGYGGDNAGGSFDNAGGNVDNGAADFDNGGGGFNDPPASAGWGGAAASASAW